MALSFVNIFKKEDAETESNGVEHVEASGIAETQNDEPKKRVGTARAVPAAGPVRKPELEVNPPGLKPGGVSFDPLTLNKSDTPRVLNLQKAPFGFFSQDVSKFRTRFSSLLRNPGQYT